MSNTRKMVFCGLLILLFLALSASTCTEVCGRDYDINVSGIVYCCDSYAWDGNDLHLHGCGISGSPTIMNASNVSIKKY